MFCSRTYRNNDNMHVQYVLKLDHLSYVEETIETSEDGGKYSEELVRGVGARLY